MPPPPKVAAELPLTVLSVSVAVSAAMPPPSQAAMLRRTVLPLTASVLLPRNA